MRRVTGLTLLLCALMCPSALAANSSVSIPENYSPYLKSGTFSYFPDTGTAQVTFQFKRPVTYDFERDLPIDWRDHPEFKLFGKNRYSTGSISVRVSSDDAVWSVSGYSGSQKIAWLLAPDAMSMSSTFTSPAIKGLRIWYLGNESYELPSFWVGPRTGAIPMTSTQLDLQGAQTLSALRLKRLMGKKSYQLQTNSCQFPLSNTASCRLNYTTGKQRWGITIRLTPDSRALRRGMTQWSIANSRPGKLAPLLPTLPAG